MGNFKITKIFDPKLALYDFMKLTGALPVLVDLRMKRLYINGKKPKKYYRGKYLVCSNHISYIDPVILANAFVERRMGFVATKELFDTKFKNFLFTSFGCVKIDKENPSMMTFKKVGKMLDRGHTMCVFPEGVVETGNELQSFKTGIILMAVMNKADIVPVYIVKREKRIKRQVVLMGNKIKINELVKSDFPTLEELNNAANYLKEKELELEQYYQSYKTKKEGRRHGK